MLWSLCDEEVKTQVAERVEKSRKTQRVATQASAKYKIRERKSKRYISALHTVGDSNFNLNHSILLRFLRDCIIPILSSPFNCEA